MRILLKDRRALTSSMQVKNFATIKDLENNRLLVNKLEIIIIDEIKKKLKVFIETTESLTYNKMRSVLKK
ncbi:hypothetical protein G4B88_006707 [Cannabis sativa]|uniref:Uncharacterized protein n=1 Tax=Cannabis sativa TaxID=3483 RepID=A0A7J6GUH5_CANSA|nr:hypothetical protein G4B88_006707 [Cannabis sativa]